MYCIPYVYIALVSRLGAVAACLLLPDILIALHQPAVEEEVLGIRLSEGLEKEPKTWWKHHKSTRNASKCMKKTPKAIEDDDKSMK